MPSESSEDRAAAKVAQTAQTARTPQPVVREVAPQSQPALTMKDLTKDEQIFIEGALNRAIQVHQTSVHDVDDLHRVISNLHEVWSRPLE